MPSLLSKQTKKRRTKKANTHKKPSTMVTKKFFKEKMAQKTLTNSLTPSDKGKKYDFNYISRTSFVL